MTEEETMPEYVERAQVMEMLGVKRSKMSLLIHQLNIPTHKSEFSRQTLLHRDDVKRLLDMKRNLSPKGETNG